MPKMCCFHSSVLFPLYSTAVYQSSFTTTLQYNGSIQYLEHIVARMTADTTSGNRRDTRIDLTSPMGTQSTLLSHRNNDFIVQQCINFQNFVSIKTIFWKDIFLCCFLHSTALYMKFAMVYFLCPWDPWVAGFHCARRFVPLPKL